MNKVERKRHLGTLGDTVPSLQFSALTGADYLFFNLFFFSFCATFTFVGIYYIDYIYKYPLFFDCLYDAESAESFTSCHLVINSQHLLRT